jgi:hypothetical protein
MTTYAVLNGESRHHCAPQPTRTTCTLPDGEVLESYATHLSPTGAFILAMKPPPLRSRLTVQIHPPGLRPLPPLEARVVNVRIDPALADRTGFEVVFPRPDDHARHGLETAVARLDSWKLHDRRRHLRRSAERREYPRVFVDMKAHVLFPNGDTVILGVRDISMSGAFLALGKSRPSLGVVPGAELVLTILPTDVPECINVRARVARLGGAGEPAGFGVLFVEPDDTTERRIEGLILHAVIEDHRRN